MGLLLERGKNISGITFFVCLFVCLFVLFLFVFFLVSTVTTRWPQSSVFDDGFRGQ